MLALCVVLTVITYTTTDTTRVLINCVIKMTTGCVVVAVALLASVCLFAERRLPRQVVEEILALFAIQTLGVVRTFAFAVHHVELVVKRQIVEG